MISMLLISNAGYGKIIHQGAKFALSIGIATISGITQTILRQLQYEYKDSISQVTGLAPNRVSDIRRNLRPVVLILNIALLFKGETTSLSQFVCKHLFWIAIEGILVLKGIEPFHSSIEGFDKRVSVPNFLKKINEKTVALIKPLLKLAQINNPWLRALGVAFLEEFIFRVILQEGFLRQLPKLGLRVTKLASPEIIDSPISKITRISISSLIFGLGHLQKGISYVIDTTLRGISNGYIHENIGFLPAILIHFDVNFYCNLARPSYQSYTDLYVTKYYINR
ncbi:MAG TPA: CPBP family intramembrane glutamic endopeptidase [Rhabdochlamydiaceae bacterium]|nr:CPBP family intramembrane glutamic endopeptidase [Rhabdochlamydiaceae bacterium]